MKFNYQTICQGKLLKDLSERTKEVISRRFGLTGEKETLESIGETYGITRERTRQIEEDGLKRLEKKLGDPVCQNVFRYFVSELKASGALRKEDILLNLLGGSEFKNHVFFLLTLGRPFERLGETKDFYALWTIDKNSLSVARNRINSFITNLKEKNRPLSLPSNVLPAYVEISKYILRSPEGLYGLRDWSEINPRGIKDKAYIVLRKEKKPLHFTEVTTLINNLTVFKPPKPVIFQTVHNELIKDTRFVLVGRGLYALQEWGYEPGVVREVISKVLQESRKPLRKEEVVEKVLKQRQVKVNTVLLNLQNKKHFLKNSEGKYTVRKT